MRVSHGPLEGCGCSSCQVESGWALELTWNAAGLGGRVTGLDCRQGSPWWGGGYQGPGVSSGTAGGGLGPRHPLLSVRTVSRRRVLPCVRFQVRLLQPRARSGVGQDEGRLCLPADLSLAPSQGDSGGCVRCPHVSVGAVPAAPQLAPSRRSPGHGGSASRGPRLLVWACGGAGGVTAEVGARVDPPPRPEAAHVGVPGPWGHFRAVSPPGQPGAHL